MDYRGFASNLNEHTHAELKKQLNLIHQLYDARSLHIEAINDNWEYYEQYSIKWDKVNIYDNTTLIKVPSSNSIKGGVQLDYVKMSYIKAYNRLTTHIGKAKHRAKLYTHITSITDVSYKEMMKCMNFEFTNHCLKGGRSYLGNAMGSIFIRMSKFNEFKMIVDWAASMKFRKAIVERGGTPRDYLHPNGELWLCYFEPCNFPYFKWTKFQSKCENKEYYRFDVWRNAANEKSNGKIDPTNRDTILSNPVYSPMKRLATIFHNCKDQVKEYWRNTNYKNWDQSAFDKNYVDMYQKEKREIDD